MVLAAFHPVTLDDFSQLPNIEESPAWEFLNGRVLQKPMPTFYHSLLQKYLVRAIDNTNSEYEAFPELRCVLSKNSIVPDVTIIHKSRIPLDNSAIQGAPDWLIEILSTDQSTTKLIAKIQDCLTEGAKLGWLIDSQEEVIMIFLPDRPLQIVSGNDQLTCLDGLTLPLTPNQLFSHLKR
ncbi:MULTISPECIES: Uma2 family endonuclease [unclassified Pseudanabaena]|uniref:Uma2 family endonuclease n=1 Tax=unclassified Pseudanabaena TaxID=2593292 RepID=UPI0006D7745A|nr:MULTISPECIES: Uma2 family endonuclease [unclassified Pseudanabaena]TYQ30758.1 Uma2 family endonuclease [Pseudanabaena sp. UWO310]